MSEVGARVTNEQGVAMGKRESFLQYLIDEQPVFLKSLALARRQGLIVVDEEFDAVGASNRLLLTSDVLQEVLNEMVGDWMDFETGSAEHFAKLISEEGGDE